MNIEAHYIIVGGIKVEVVRKAIKNLHVAVYPPNGRVRVAAPLSVDDDAVRLAVVTRMGWIKRQKNRFKAQARQSVRAYVSGETHYFLGQRYRLKLIEGATASKVHVRGRMLELHVRAGSDQVIRERVVLAWYRQELRTCAVPLVEKWASVTGIPSPSWGIKRMRTKWGTCNIASRRIWLNLELVKKLPQCLDYIVLHELAHFFERNHSERFVALMDRLMPQWRSIRDELNAGPLTYEDWAA